MEKALDDIFNIYSANPYLKLCVYKELWKYKVNILWKEITEQMEWNMEEQYWGWENFVDTTETYYGSYSLYNYRFLESGSNVYYTHIFHIIPNQFTLAV